MRRSKKNWQAIAGAAGAALAGFFAARAGLRKLASVDLRDKTVIVTGGSRGLGFLLAQEFARKGANVAICGKDAAAVEIARGELERLGVRVLARACDIGNRAAAEAFVDAVERAFGRIDVLINNAGIIRVGPVEDETAESMEQTMRSNFMGHAYITFRALPHLRKQGRQARIVNITSIGGRVAVPHLLSYDASKFAFVGFSEGLRAELDAKRDMPRVVTVIPGLMRTGSFYNAAFVGNRSKEFAWFSVASSLPILTVDATKAARRILRAARDGRPFLVVGLSGHIADIAHRISPGLTSRLLSLNAAFLPEPNGETEAVKGRDVESDLPGSPALRLGDIAAQENNELPPFHSIWTNVARRRDPAPN